MWAWRLTTILPAMRLAEALETTRIPRVAGRIGARTDLAARRPCRAPPHTIAEVRLIGGGQVPRPGEVSLAPHGVLFLGEWPEFRRHVLEVLRQPLYVGGGHANTSPDSFESCACPRLRTTHNLKRGFTCTPGKLLINRPYLVQAATHVIMPPNER
jgi:hypothetical protein